MNENLYQNRSQIIVRLAVIVGVVKASNKIV